MSMRPKSIEQTLHARICSWRAGRILRFCWALATFSDLGEAGFKVDQSELGNAKNLWPIPTILSVLTSISKQPGWFKTHIPPFAGKFAKDLHEYLLRTDGENARVQLLWLTETLRKGPQKLAALFLAYLTRCLEPPQKRADPISCNSKPHFKIISEQLIQRRKDMAKGRRLVLTRFAEIVLQEIVCLAPEPAGQAPKQHNPAMPDTEQSPHDQHGPDPPR